jgi:thiamine-monophosphate kinase
VGGAAHDIEVGGHDADDCAVIHIDGSVDVVVGSDYVRGPKFTLYEAGFLTPWQLGWFCVTANASDLAAMGASPLGYLAVVRYPKEMSDDDFMAVMSGIDEACRASDLRLLGGDTGSAERLILSGTALGLCEAGSALRRCGAEPGDVVAVTGQLGGAGAAVAAVTRDVHRKLTGSAWASLLDCWTAPRAHIDAGRALARTGVRVACQDVSDGLRATAREIGEASHVSVILDLDALPLRHGVADVAALIGVPTEALAISASTDFCLAFACHPDDFGEVSESLATTGYSATIVGRCEPGEGVWTVSRNGDLIVAPGEEWRHQDDEIKAIIDRLRND